MYVKWFRNNGCSGGVDAEYNYDLNKCVAYEIITNSGLRPDIKLASGSTPPARRFYLKIDAKMKEIKQEVEPV